MHAHSARALSLSTQFLGLSVPGLQAMESLRFGDVEEQASALTGWNQDYLQLSAGAFQGEICQLQGVGIKLFIERVQQSLFQTGVLPGHVLALGIPLDASGTSMFCGKACAADVLHVFSGSSGFEFRTSRQHTMLGVELKLNPGWLSHGGDSSLHAVSRDLPTQACALGLTRAALADLKNYLLALLRSAQCNPGLLCNPAVVATVVDYLLDRMLPLQAGLGATAEKSAPWKLVQQACARVHDQLEQAPTVSQLCVDLGVSRRTLQNGFQRVLNISPLAYLKAVRLGKARRALKQVGSVTEAATAYGFWHFGHFSQDYLAMFGERPSETLRRNMRC